MQYPEDSIRPTILLIGANNTCSTRMEELCVFCRKKGWLVVSRRSETAALESSIIEDQQTAMVWILEPVDSLDLVRKKFPNAMITGSAAESGQCDLIVPNLNVNQIPMLIDHAEQYWRAQLLAKRHLADLGLKRKQISQLTEIGLALGAEPDPDKLLGTILSEARSIVNCEAGSLYLIDESGEAPMLAFKLAQNDCVAVHIEETLIPLSEDSLAGYVAISGKELVVSDAYQIAATEPYQFNRTFDEQHNYRTHSLVVVPMRDHRGSVVGVMQFINRKLPDGSLVKFDMGSVEMLRAIASQAAIAIQKTNLLNNINQLFESFVQASVKAIEQRDPSTSGHSFRVAETTTTLLEDLSRSGHQRFCNMRLSEDQLREVRYAALLHDFGKVGVSESILLKSTKLSEDRLEALKLRFELKKEQLRRIALEKELELLHRRQEDLQLVRRRIHSELEKQITILNDYYSSVVAANKPSILPEGDFQILRSINLKEQVVIEGQTQALLSQSELELLSIRKGSLSKAERLEIQNHVVYTREFLAALPWTPELARVPEIAAAHHEKVDGSGYPCGLVGEKIPLASRVMTVCDIYDALTAMDRPYKSAMSQDSALSVLDEEVAAGLLDADIVEIFKTARPWRVLNEDYAQRRVVGV